MEEYPSFLLGQLATKECSVSMDLAVCTIHDAIIKLGSESFALK